MNDTLWRMLCLTTCCPIARVIIKMLVLFAVLASTPIIIFNILVSAIVRIFSKPLSIRISSFIPLYLWSWFHIIFKLSFKVSIPKVTEGNAIVISNHISAGDFLFVNALNKYLFKDAKYAIKQSLRLLPIFYQGSLLAKFLIIKRNFESDKESITNYFKEMNLFKIPCWFVLFPEGHRFSAQRAMESQEFCKNRGIAPFKHVLCPRYKGFDLIMKSINEQYITKLVDLTIFIEDDVPSLARLLFSSTVYTCKCDVKMIDIKDVGNPKVFLEQAFRRKDELIEKWRSEKRK